MIVRRMTLEDVSPMLRLQKMLSVEKPVEYPKQNLEAYVEHIVSAINSPTAFFFVALEDTVLGYILAWVVDRVYTEPREYCFFGEIYIVPESRDAQVGSRLFEAVFKAADEYGIEEYQCIDTVDPSRWDRFGFSTYAYVKRLRNDIAERWVRRSA